MSPYMNAMHVACIWATVNGECLNFDFQFNIRQRQPLSPTPTLDFFWLPPAGKSKMFEIEREESVKKFQVWSFE